MLLLICLQSPGTNIPNFFKMVQTYKLFKKIQTFCCQCQLAYEQNNINLRSTHRSILDYSLRPMSPRNRLTVSLLMLYSAGILLLQLSHPINPLPISSKKRKTHSFLIPTWLSLTRNLLILYSNFDM